MAELKVSKNKMVKGLKKEFKEAFGATLRIYTTVECKRFADDSARLSTLMDSNAKGGDVAFGPQTQVGNFEKKMKETFGIGVQVANKDNTALSPDTLTLKQAGAE